MTETPGNRHAVAGDPSSNSHQKSLSYVVQSMRELARYRFPPIAVRLDGSAHQVGSVIVSKGRLYAGRYLVAPGGSPTRPGFSVVLFERPGAWQAALCGVALPLNLLAHMPGVRVVRADVVELDCVGVPTQADGDPAGGGRLRITDAAGPIAVVIG